MNFADYLALVRPRIEKDLKAGLPSVTGDANEPEAVSAHATDDLNAYLYEPLRQFSAQGGKRVRPALALLGAEAVGGNPQEAFPIASAIEDFQSAALIHDDIADGSKLRRGNPCLYRTLGVGLAINVGDAALVNVVSRIARSDTYNNDVKIRLIDALLLMQEHTLEGQALDLGWTRENRWDITSDDYLFMATSKTAYYSAACPLVAGAIVGGGSQRQQSALRSFGMKAGLAFQLQDDLLNLVGDGTAQGKDFRSDITEGKRTLLVVRALEALLASTQEGETQTASEQSDIHVTNAALSADVRGELISLLSSKTNDPILLERAVALIESSGALDFVRLRAQSLIAEAKEHLNGAEFDAEARDTLLSMADFFVDRKR
ncbi:MULTISPECIES: polyprenyl synthetase family protein [Atopobiaceae]|uniref:polyprenyl synthetase family protein n=1 Tax=Atopobiaceae TaxID=1643824 RepID=UPI00034E5905|nr:MULTISPECIES: polyprenyl synthetase family protein [Atopobiaceae]EPD77377.1 geranylgeranyl diphosphate synthase, type I [Atopobium sp. oral taxon 199 str. F0494]